MSSSKKRHTFHYLTGPYTCSPSNGVGPDSKIEKGLGKRGRAQQARQACLPFSPCQSFSKLMPITPQVDDAREPRQLQSVLDLNAPAPGEQGSRVRVTLPQPSGVRLSCTIIALPSGSWEVSLSPPRPLLPPLWKDQCTSLAGS